MTKVNSNLMKETQEKESIIKGMEDIRRNEDEADIEVVDTVNTTVHMDKNISGHKCTACDQSFKTNKGLENHMTDKHTETECPFCNQEFTSRCDLRKHVNICVENGYIKEKCTKCKQTFTKFGLGRHIKQFNVNKGEIITCKKCELICKKHDINEEAHEGCITTRMGKKYQEKYAHITEGATVLKETGATVAM